MKRNSLLTGLLLPALCLVFLTSVLAEDFKQGHGTRTVITTSYQWESSDERYTHWVVDVPGTPAEVYVIDQEAIEEISHIEIIHHEAVTHQQKVYGTRRKTTITYVDPTIATHQVTKTKVFYNLTDGEIKELYIEYEITDIKTANERYVVRTDTIVDQEAYDEEITVIDQEANEEIGHYETQIIGEQGHYETNADAPFGHGSGTMTGHVTTATY